MARSHLRVYYGPAEETTAALTPTASSKQQITLPLGEIAPLLADAVRTERTWLQDLQDDEITISADLYEVLLAYQHFRLPSA